MARYNVYFKSEDASPCDSNRNSYTIDASNEQEAIAKWKLPKQNCRRRKD